MREALSAHVEGSAPIGAVVVDAGGEVIARGRNSFSTDRLAHAETEALRAVPTDANRTSSVIYTTMEPCPMCTGAIRMMQLQAVHLGARDPAAGSTSLLNANEFMREFRCRTVEPRNPELEFASVALLMEYRKRTQHLRWRDAWRAYHPLAVEAGERLADSNRYKVAFAREKAHEQIFEEVCSFFLQPGTAHD